MLKFVTIRSLIHLAALVAAWLCLAAVVEAAPITYVITGTASGMIGGTAFTNALVQVTATGDTGNVVPLNVGGYDYFANVPSATTVTIAGIGTATVTGAAAPGLSPNPVGIFAFPTPIQLEPTLPATAVVVIGTLDFLPALIDFTGIGAVGGDALLGYDLRTSIGPITAGGGVGYPPSLFVYTTLGNLSFTENLSGSSPGTFAATATVPEPTSLLLTAIGLLGVATTRVRRSHS